MRFYTYLTITLFALLSIGCASGIPTAKPPTIVNNAETWTVMLVSAHNYHVYCGATIVGARALATAAHCVDHIMPEEAAYYVTHEGYQFGWKRYAAWVLERDTVRDVALLKPTQAFESWAPVRFDELTEGEPVCAMHHSSGNPYSFACGVILEPTEPAPKLTEYRTTLPVWFGASGSGLWDSQGRLSGVAVRVHLLTGWGIYVSAQPVIELLQETGM